MINGTAADTLLGKPVQSASGDDMGRVVDVVVDHTGLVRAAIIDFGGFLGVGTRKIAVDWRVLHFPKDGSMEKIIADLSQDQLRAAPAYKPGEPVVIVGRADIAPSPAPTPSASAPSASAPPAPATPPPAPPGPVPSTTTPQTATPPQPTQPAPAPANTNPAPTEGGTPTQKP